jgi:hypothetical protein
MFFQARRRKQAREGLKKLFGMGELRSRAFGQALKGCVEFRKKFRKSFENV